MAYTSPPSDTPYVKMEQPPAYADLEKDSRDPVFVGFDQKTVRRQFIRKVFLILLAQLSFTFAVIAVFTFVKEVKAFVNANPTWIWVSYGTFLVLYILLACCKKLRRRFPYNLIFLSLFTISFTYLASAITVQFDTLSVIATFATCVTCCAVIVGFSYNTKYDLISWVGFLVIFSWCLFIFGISFAFRVDYPAAHKAYSLLSALLFMGFLAIDCQLLIGNQEYALSPEEYVYAALQIYIDVMYVFLMLLSAFGKRN